MSDASAPTEVVIFKEKHGHRHYLITAVDTWERICMAVFRSRDGEGYWYPNDPAERWPDGPPTRPEPMEVASATGAEAFAKAMRDWEREFKQYKSETEFYALMVRARNGDLAAAAEIIERRKGHQYEGYDRTRLDKVDEDIPHRNMTLHERAMHLRSAMLILLANPIGSRFGAAEMLEEANGTRSDPAPPAGLAILDEYLDMRPTSLQRTVAASTEYIEEMLTDPTNPKVVQMVLYHLDVRGGFVGDGPKAAIERFGGPEAFATAVADYEIEHSSSKYRQRRVDGREARIAELIDLFQSFLER